METDRLSSPLRNLSEWTAQFCRMPIPVLAGTAQAMEELHQAEDSVDANLIGETLSGDPLMTLRVLVHAAVHRPARVLSAPETVTSAVVMMGIGPFFRDLGSLATVEEKLHDQPDALEGLREVLRRAHRAARFALGFAVHRTDPEAAGIHHAALLHDFADMLLWCHAPVLALRIREAQRADPALRSACVQREVLNVTLGELQQALMGAWRLPERLKRITDDRHAEHPSTRSVALAMRLARHTAHGWDNAALPDDMRDVAALLNLSEVAARALVGVLDS
jgi:HD-like signal output (HDOD) protein